MTLDCLLNANICPGSDVDSENGFLDYVGLLAKTAPQVQLECLLRTWQKLSTTDAVTPLELCDHVVIQAATERLAALALSDDTAPLQMAWDGPRSLSLPLDCWVYSKVRWLQSTNLDNSGHLNRLDLPYSPANQLLQTAQRICGNPPEFERLLDVVGQWRIDRVVLENLDGLLTGDEHELLQTFFQEHPALLS